MKKVEWPGRTCRETLWNGDIAHQCAVVELHPGPCATPNIPATEQRRDQWEKDNPDWERDMRTDPFVD